MNILMSTPYLNLLEENTKQEKQNKQGSFALKHQNMNVRSDAPITPEQVKSFHEPLWSEAVVTCGLKN